MSTDMLRIEYVVFNKLYDIVKAKSRLPKGLLLIGPRSVGKSFILSRLMSLFLLRDISALKKCLPIIDNSTLQDKECITIKKLIELINDYGIIPLVHDCKSSGSLSLEHIDRHARTLLGLSDRRSEHMILLLIDNVHFCYDSVREVFDSFLARNNVIVVAASPTAYRPRELKRKEFENIRFYPLRFGEISIELIPELKNKEGSYLLPLKGDKRRQRVTNIYELIDHIRIIDRKLLNDELYDRLMILFALYSVFGGTIAGYNTLSSIINNNSTSVSSLTASICSESEEVTQFLEGRLRPYVSAMKKTYDDIIDDALQVHRNQITDIHKPYVEATFQVLAKLIFEDKNITLSREQLIEKAVRIGHDIALSPLNTNEARKAVKLALSYLSRADILFEIKRYRFHIRNRDDNEQCGRSRENNTVKANKYVYSDPRYLYAAYYGYLLHTPYDSVRDPSSLVMDKLKKILKSMLCTNDRDSSRANEELIGILLEMLTLQNICLNLYGIRASADKPRDPQPACHGLYTYRVEASKLQSSTGRGGDNSNGETNCRQLEIDALIVQNRPLYGIEISRSAKGKSELECAIKTARKMGFKAVFNIYLRSYTKNVSLEEDDGVRIVYVPVPILLLATL